MRSLRYKIHCYYTRLYLLLGYWRREGWPPSASVPYLTYPLALIPLHPVIHPSPVSPRSHAGFVHIFRTCLWFFKLLQKGVFKHLSTVQTGHVRLIKIALAAKQPNCFAPIQNCFGRMFLFIYRVSKKNAPGWPGRSGMSSKWFFLL